MIWKGNKLYGRLLSKLVASTRRKDLKRFKGFKLRDRSRKIPLF
jgi:hypothetical protein